MNLRILLIATLLANALWARALPTSSAGAEGPSAVASCCCAPEGRSSDSACASEGCTCHVAPAPDPQPAPPAPAPRTPDTLSAVLPRDCGVELSLPMLDAAPRRWLFASDRPVPSHNETQALLGVWRT